MTSPLSNSPPVTTLGSLLFRAWEQFPCDRLLCWNNGKTEIVYSTAGFEEAVLKLHRWLVSALAELREGDSIAILSENRPEWHIAEFACHLAGLTPVPVYRTLSDEQTRFILSHSGARVVFCGVDHAQKVLPMLDSLPDVLRVISFDDDLPGLLAVQPSISRSERAELRRRAAARDPECVATIVYTSGTTGVPKGVMLTHRNLLSNVLGAIDRLTDASASTALSVLPLSHIFERMLCYCYLYRGVSIVYGDPYSLKESLPRYRPAIMGAVPRMLEKMREGFQTALQSQPVFKQKLAGILIDAGYRKLDGHPGVLSLLAERLLFRRVRAQLGNLQTIVAGGAWLNPELERFFRAIGLRVLQGYGLTETSPVIACNEIGRERIGSVGRTLPGVDVRIDGAGELLVRGPNVMKGYFRNPEATAEAFRGGWFRTGDLGHIDVGGFLFITGRRKEMLLLSNGKNVYYPPIEQALRQSPFIEQALLIGEGRNYAAVVIVPNLIALQRLAGDGAIQPANEFEAHADLLRSASIQELYRAEIERLTRDFARFEQPKRFGFLDPAVLADPELVTPTMKVRPGMLEKRYGKQIDGVYTLQTCTIVSTSS